ncbi:MAG TPA: CHASE2 domain-containing protein [Candidatus Krumholzibacteria bacterium]|nr:CHASE2 domain-containing protein [Candidatus Krumholzibacteria bacterium]
MNREKFVVGSVIGGVSALLTLAGHLSGVWERVEGAAIDLRFHVERQLESSDAQDSSVVVVDFDEATLARFKEKGRSWPLDRGVHRTILRYVARGGPRVVAYDVRFEEPHAVAPELDQMLIDEIAKFDTITARAGRPEDDPAAIVLASFFSARDANPRAEALLDTISARQDRLELLAGHALPVALPLEVAPRWYRAHTLLEGLLRRADGIGASTVIAGVDGTYRRVPLFATWRGLSYPALGLAAALAGPAEDAAIIVDGGGVSVDGEEIPLDDGEFWLHWRDEYTGAPYPVLPAARVYANAMADTYPGVELDPSLEMTPEVFRDRVVLIGATGSDTGELRLASPFHPTEPGLHLQATLIQTLISGDHLRPLGHGSGAVLVALIALVTGLGFALIDTTLGRVVAFLAAMILLAAVSLFGFVAAGWILPWVALCLGVTLAFVGNLLPRTIVDEVAALQGWLYRHLPAAWRSDVGSSGIMPPRVFLSYRRQDSLVMTARLRDKLADRFGAERVFMDFDAIPFGADFRAHLQQELDQCDVFLVMIGPDWAGAVEGPARNRLLGDPNDFVRMEVEVALEKRLPVIPVLVGGAKMPAEDEVPPSMREVLFLQAASLDSGLDFHVHAERLLAALVSMPRGSRPVTAPDDDEPPEPRAMSASAGRP